MMVNKTQESSKLLDYVIHVLFKSTGYWVPVVYFDTSSLMVFMAQVSIHQYNQPFSRAHPKNSVHCHCKINNYELLHTDLVHNQHSYRLQTCLSVFITDNL